MPLPKTSMYRNDRTLPTLVLHVLDQLKIILREKMVIFTVIGCFNESALLRNVVNIKRGVALLVGPVTLLRDDGSSSSLRDLSMARERNHNISVCNNAGLFYFIFPLGKLVNVIHS